MVRRASSRRLGRALWNACRLASAGCWTTTRPGCSFFVNARHVKNVFCGRNIGCDVNQVYIAHAQSTQSRVEGQGGAYAPMEDRACVHKNEA